MKFDAVVIGGGASGMMAAGRAAGRGKRVALLESKPQLGRKLRITGKGRCNVTNDCDAETVIRNTARNPRFLYGALRRFSPADTVAFFNGLGVPTKVERGSRVFPASDKAADIAGALERYCAANGVTIIRNAPATGVRAEGGKVAGVETGRGFYGADAVIIATGGKSYPATGSTGDGYRFAAELGHTVTRLTPSLAPLVAAENWVPGLEGLSLKNVGIELKTDAGAAYSDFGEMLFTKSGVSGPIILSASAHLPDDGHAALSIDLKPALDAATLDRRLLRDFEDSKNKELLNALEGLLPRRLIPAVIAAAGISPEKRVHSVTKSERAALIGALKALKLTITGAAGFDEAIITRGGVNTAEVDPKTMGSKLRAGLYFCGEVLDLDAYTGGYNLQIAFSTGFVAGDSII